MKKSLGKFIVESGTIHVSDPCYDQRDGGFTISATKGEWNASVNTSNSKGIASITATLKGSKGGKWSRMSDVGVDSGQMGIFDSKFYRKDSERGTIPLPDFCTPKRLKEEGPGEEFYGACCTLTMNTFSAGTLPHGAVSSSGWGDGLYPLYVKTDAEDNVVGIQVRF